MRAVGSDAMIMEGAVLAGMASDLYAEGSRPVVVVRPGIGTALAAAVATATSPAIGWYHVAAA